MGFTGPTAELARFAINFRSVRPTLCTGYEEDRANAPTAAAVDFFFPLSYGVKAQGGLLNSIMKFRIIGVQNTNSGAVADGTATEEENTGGKERCVSQETIPSGTQLGV